MGMGRSLGPSVKTKRYLESSLNRVSTRPFAGDVLAVSGPDHNRFEDRFSFAQCRFPLPG